MRRDICSIPNRRTALYFYAVPSEKVFSLDIAIMTAPSADAPGVTPTKMDTVNFPAGTNVINNIQNPQASCIEMLVRETGVPPYVVLLRKLFPRYPYRANPVEILYVYHADRKELVELGRVPETSSSVPDIENAFWQPDGKHIQFFYHNAVYIVPAD